MADREQSPTPAGELGNYPAGERCRNHRNRTGQYFGYRGRRRGACWERQSVASDWWRVWWAMARSEAPRRWA